MLVNHGEERTFTIDSLKGIKITQKLKKEMAGSEKGKKIRLGDLGDFSILLSSKGAEDADKFTAQNITDVKVQWEPGAEFKNLVADAEFNLVASRSAQAAVIKAIKEGKANVDISTRKGTLRGQAHQRQGVRQQLQEQPAYHSAC